MNMKMKIAGVALAAMMTSTAASAQDVIGYNY